MDSQTVHWKQPGTEIKADPGATVALDRVQWEGMGALFELIDDEDGETPGLAVLEIAAEGTTISIGILDYGAAETFLLVPGSGAEQRRNVDAVLKALTSAGLVAEADIVSALGEKPRFASAYEAFRDRAHVDLTRKFESHAEEWHVDGAAQVIVNAKQIAGEFENLAVNKRLEFHSKRPSPLIRKRASNRPQKITSARASDSELVLTKKQHDRTGRVVVRDANGKPVVVIWDN